MDYCELANQVKEWFGIEACCHPKQNNYRCDNYADESLRCSFGSPCPSCGKTRVVSYDPCYGKLELCLNPDCECDK